MRLKNSAMFIGLVLITVVVLPVKSSDLNEKTLKYPVIKVEISKNIATLEGRVASRLKAKQAENLVFYSLAEIDWIENKLKIDASVAAVEPLRGVISHLEYKQVTRNSG